MGPNMNVVILIGRLVADPVKGKTSTTVANFTMAVDKRGKIPEGQPDADFIDCAAWDKTGEITLQYATKGRLVAVNGTMQTRMVEKDGNKVKYTTVRVHDIQLLDKSGNVEKSAHNDGPEPDDVADDDVPF